jgi:hypothetical protein
MEVGLICPGRPLGPHLVGQKKKIRETLGMKMMIKEIRKDTMPVARFYAMPMLMQTQSRYARMSSFFQILACDADSMPNTSKR